MPLSMTGFGEGAAENENYEAKVTLRSVNHRFLDISVRMPEEHRSLEPGIVLQLRARLERGRIEARLSIGPRATRGLEIKIDEAAAARYLEASRHLGAKQGASETLETGTLLRLPGVVSVEAVENVFSDADRGVLDAAVESALERLLEARAREGAELTKVLRRAVAGLGEVVAKLTDLRAPLQQDLLERLQARLAELTGGAGFDVDRLAQEAALLVDKADIQEELDRLKLHVEHFGTLLAEDGAVGKRLDFLAQEILRELNTIGSKSRSSAATQLVLDGKVLCEQLREQVQNVE